MKSAKQFLKGYRLSIPERSAELKKMPETNLVRHHFQSGNEGMMLIAKIACPCGGRLYSNHEYIRCTTCLRAWAIDLHVEVDR